MSDTIPTIPTTRVDAAWDELNDFDSASDWPQAMSDMADFARALERELSVAEKALSYYAHHQHLTGFGERARKALAALAEMRQQRKEV